MKLKKKKQSFSVFQGIFIFLFLQISNASIAQSEKDSIISLSGVEIRDSVYKRANSISLIPGKSLDKSPLSDVGEILRHQPNVSGIRRGGYAIDPVIRGFRYSQVNIHLDEGIHIEGGCPNRMDPVLSHIEPEGIKQIEIIRGPYLLQYGPAQGAIIRVITNDSHPFDNKKMEIGSFTGYDANRQGFRQHVSVSGSAKNLYYRISGGIKDFGNYRDGNGKEWNSAFNKKDALTDFGYRINKRSGIHFSYKGSFGREVYFPTLPMDEIKDNTNIFSADYKTHNPDNPENNLQVSGFHTRVYHEMDNRFRPQYNQIVLPYTGLMQASAKVNTHTTGLRAIMNRKTGNILINGGIDVEHSWKDGSRNMRMIMEMEDQEFISEKLTNLWKEASILNTGIFAGFSSGKKKVHYKTTLRFDINYSDSKDTLLIRNNNITWFDSRPAVNFLWSLASGAVWQINEKFSLSFDLARGSRSPDLQERYIKFLATGYDKYDYLGNPELKPEINYQADIMIGYSNTLSEIYLNVFRSEVRDFITGTLVPPSVARPVSMGAPGVKQFNNINRAVLYGFEAGITARGFEKLNLSFSTGYTYAYFPEIEKYQLENGQITGTILLQNDPIAEIPALEATANAGYTFLKGKLNPLFTIRAVADQKHVSDASYEDSTPGYVIADFSVNYNPGRYFSVTTGLTNLFDKAYYDHLNRKQTGTTDKIFEPGRTFFVNLKIKI